MTGPDPLRSASVSTDTPRGGRFGRVGALWVRSAVVMALILAVLYAIEGIDAATDYDLNRDGITARDADGLWGIVFSPFLHANFEHLTSNAMVGAVLGFLLLVARRFLLATLVVWITSGFGVWLFGPSDAVTIGASGIIFGWLAFLLVRGIVNRAAGQIVLGVGLFLLYGALLFGVLPGRADISWQAHLFGALGGVLTAILLAGRDRRRTTADPASARVVRPPGSVAR